MGSDLFILPGARKQDQNKDTKGKGKKRQVEDNSEQPAKRRMYSLQSEHL